VCVDVEKERAWGFVKERGGHVPDQASPISKRVCGPALISDEMSECIEDDAWGM
jgi:hypothetical protein